MTTPTTPAPSLASLLVVLSDGQTWDLASNALVCALTPAQQDALDNGASLQDLEDVTMVPLRTLLPSQS